MTKAKTTATNAVASIDDVALLALANEVLPAAHKISGLSATEVTLDEQGKRFVRIFSSYSWLTYAVAAPDDVTDPDEFKAALAVRILG